MDWIMSVKSSGVVEKALRSMKAVGIVKLVGVIGSMTSNLASLDVEYVT